MTKDIHLNRFMDFPGFELWLSQRGVEDSTIRMRQSYYAKFPHPFTLEAIQDRILSERKRGISVGTLNNYVSVIRNYCQFKRLKWGKKIKYWKQKRIEKETLTEDEIRKLLNIPIEAYYKKSAHAFWTLFWRMMAGGGYRCNELAQLTVQQIDFAGRSIHLGKTKSGSRTVPIPSGLVEELADFCKDKEKYVFKQVQQSTWRTDFVKRLKYLGITRGITPHSLRHSFITRMLSEAQCPIFDVKAIVGHKNIKTTELYYHSSLRTLRNAIDRDTLFLGQMKSEDKLNLVKRHLQELKELFKLDTDNDLDCTIIEEGGAVSFGLKIKPKKKKKSK